MKITESRRIYVLYANEERVYNPYDRNDYPIGGIVPATDSVLEKRLVEAKTTSGAVASLSSFPVSIVYDNTLYQESDDGRAGSGDNHVYAVPLFSHGVVQQLEGRLLDYIDATYAEKEQREAQKRVLRKILWGYHGELTEARKSGYERSKLVDEKE